SRPNSPYRDRKEAERQPATPPSGGADFSCLREKELATAMVHDDVLFGFRVALLADAARVGVSEACRTFGVHRSTYYHWRPKVLQFGQDALRPRERRLPRMPNQLAPWVEERVVAFALGYPG